MGTIPKRREELVDQRPSRMGGVRKGELMPVAPREPDSSWPSEVVSLYWSLKESGQNVFMQQSDWEHAWLVCSEIARYRDAEARMVAAAERYDEWVEKAGHLSEAEREAQGFSRKPPIVPRGGSAVKLQALLNELNRMMVTESARRSVHVELEAVGGVTSDASVIQLGRYREALARRSGSGVKGGGSAR